MSTLDERRRRAAYRASHRGTKEMDWLLGRYAEAHLSGMSEPDLGAFEQLVQLPDPDLQDWLMNGSIPETSAFQPLVAHIRAFHGLERPAGVLPS